MAKVIDPTKIAGQSVSDAGAAGLIYRTLIAADAGNRLSANLVTVSPRGVTRKHSHAWEQVNYIVSGRGTLVDGQGHRHPLQAGMVIHFPADEWHCFENDSDEDLLILGILGPDAV